MDLNEIIEDNNIFDDTSEYKEDVLVSDEIKKEEVREDIIIKSPSIQQVNLVQFKDILINNYNGGDSISSVNVATCTVSSSGNATVVLQIFNSDNVESKYQINSISKSGNGTVINGTVYNEYVVVSADSTCIGLNVFSDSRGTYYFCQTYAKTGQSSGVSGSSIDYSNYLQDIIDRLEVIENGVTSISDNVVSSGNGSSDGNNNQVGTVSQNILTTPINEYGLTDSLLFIGLGVALVTLIVVVVRRLIYKWN